MIDGDNLTTGIRVELITVNDGGSLLGIRVLWTIKSEYLNCQFSNLRVELNPGQHSRDITVNDRSADFYNLTCNEQYTPRVTAVVSGIQIQDIGHRLLYGGLTFMLLFHNNNSHRILKLILYYLTCIQVKKTLLLQHF